MAHGRSQWAGMIHGTNLVELFFVHFPAFIRIPCTLVQNTPYNDSWMVKMVLNHFMHFTGNQPVCL